MTGAVICSFSLPASAGFDWTPPPSAPALTITTQDEQATAAPMADVQATELMPAPGALPTETAETPVEVQEEAIASEVTVPVESAYPVEEVAAPAAGSYAEALGFGSEIPLALALGQIVPPEFVSSFAQGVNPGVKLSWNGGKSWDVVLNEALAPHGLAAQIQGKTVVVHPSEGLEARAHPNTLMIPLADESSAMSGQEMEANEKAHMSASPAAITGEGTANNYPRRTPPRNLAGSTEVMNGQTPPPPSMMEEPPAIVEESAVKEEASVEATEVASYEPAAAPAIMAEPMSQEIIDRPATDKPLRVSYADDARIEEGKNIYNRDVVATGTANLLPQKPILDPFEIRFWQADSQQSLKDVLTSWAGNAGVELIWDSGYDYKLPKAISLHGTFPDAVTQLFNLYGNAEPRPQGRLHPNLPKGPSVLLVENYP